MKVYAVERGSYSDYGIMAIFATKAAAQRAIALITNKYGDERIAEWTVWEEPPVPVTWYVKEFYRDTGSVSERAQIRDGWDTEMPYVGRVTRGLGFGSWNGNYRFWGTDQDRVRKAFDDHHARKQAEKAGVG